MSSINPNNIDGTYPIAGQDNDSQGFRDNFTNIKNNLVFAKSELEDLQSKVVLKSALNGITLDNDLSNTQLIGAQFLRTTETRNDLGTLNGTITVDWGDAHYQVLTLDNTATLNFTGWPTSGLYAKLRLLVTINNTAHTVSLPATTSVTYIGLSDIQGVVTDPTSNVPTISFSATGTYAFEFSTDDNGDTLIVRDLSRNRSPRVSYEYLTPANNSIANVSPTISTVIVRPSTAIALANIRMPGNAQIGDGHTISFAFGNTITALTHYGNGATISGALTTANVNIGAQFIYHQSTNTWYRM